MKFFTFLVMLISLSASAKELTFTWDAPSDPSAISETRLYQTGQPEPVAVAPMPDNTMSLELLPGQYCFYATFANAEVESDPSNEVCIGLLESPQNLTLEVQITTVTVN